MEERIYCKRFSKEVVDAQKAICKSIHNLEDRITCYANNGQPFAKVFNDRHLKYDRINDDIYAFKDKVSKYQLRLLYCYIEATQTLILVDYYIKQRTTKEYLDIFARHKNLKVDELLKNSYLLE